MRSWKQLRDEYWKLINKQRAFQKRIDRDTLAIFVKSRSKEDMIAMLRDMYFETATIEDECETNHTILKRIRGMCRYAKNSI